MTTRSNAKTEKHPPAMSQLNQHLTHARVAKACNNNPETSPNNMVGDRAISKFGVFVLLCFCFFRPPPSRLSPGRNTVFVPLNELCKVLYVPSLGSQKRAWTSTRSNQSNLECKPKSETRKHSLCADELIMNWTLQKANTEPTRHHSKIAVKVQKQNPSAVPKPRIPHLGSRRSHRKVHGAQGTFNRMGRPCSELGCRAAGTLPW